MKGRNNSGSNTPLFSNEEFKKMAENSQFTEEEFGRLTENAYVPPQRKVVRIDQEHDVIYYAVEEDNLNEPENSIPQKIATLRQSSQLVRSRFIIHFVIYQKHSISHCQT